MSDVLHTISYETVLASFLAGLAFGVFLWNTSPRLQPALLITAWISGLAFCVCIGVSRAIASPNTWEVWAGIAALWTWYVAVGGATVYAWRRLRRDRGGK
jgi:hypothetical protein